MSNHDKEVKRDQQWKLFMRLGENNFSGGSSFGNSSAEEQVREERESISNDNYLPSILFFWEGEDDRTEMITR